MIQKITYVVNSNDMDILQQFTDRLSMVGIQSKHIKSSDKYNYYESCWSDLDAPNLQSKGLNSKNSGAKPKQLKYNGNPVDCGLIYQLKHSKNLSDAEIASLFDVSESTIFRRRKKHLSNGDFYSDSRTIF